MTFFGCAAPTGEDGDDAPEEPTGATANALAADITVYGDNVLTKPWSNWSWNSDVSLTDTSGTRMGGTGSQIKTTLKQAWGALSFGRTTGDLPTST